MCDCVGNYVISYANVTSICLASTVTNCVCYCHFFFFFFCVGVIEIKFGIFPLLPMLTLFLFLAVALTLRSCVFFKLFYCINLQSYKLYTHRFFLFFGIIKLADIRNLYRSFSFFPIVKTTFPKLHTHKHIEKHTAPFSSHLFTMKIFEFKLNQIKKICLEIRTLATHRTNQPTFNGREEGIEYAKK